MRVVTYLRVSTERQVREGYGLQAQRSDIRRWAKAEGHRIVGWHSDEGISGANGIETREGLFDAIAAITSGAAEAIVFTSLDRLARQMTAQEAILGEVWAAGGIVFALSDGGEVLQDDPDDPMRTAARQMRGVFAELERGLIKQRMRKGKREKSTQGGYVGGAPRYGMRGGSGELVPDAGQQETIDRIVELHRHGQSLRSIIDVLNTEGRRARRGSWHPTTVQRILARSI